MNGFSHRARFQNVETFVLFIGYPRTGHSFIGSLLDAHPNILMAHELGTLQYVHVGFSQSQIFYLLYRRDRAFEERGRTSSGYSYIVPNQWQGKEKDIRVIGDKQGEGTTLRYRARPWLLQRLHRTIHKPIKYIHVIRNPYDSIASHCYRVNLRNRNWSLDRCIEHYDMLYRTMRDMLAEIPESSRIDVRHEDFIAAPIDHLQRLCSFLGVDASDDYLQACASLSFKEPNQTRRREQWSPEQRARVDGMITDHPFLHGYTYD